MRALDKEELGLRKRKVLQYVIHEYIRNQEQEDKRLDQLNLWR